MIMEPHLRQQHAGVQHTVFMTITGINRTIQGLNLLDPRSLSKQALTYLGQSQLTVQIYLTIWHIQTLIISAKEFHVYCITRLNLKF